MLPFEAWDFVLMAAVSLQALVLAYLYHPRWKALILTLPIPFSIATMAVGEPVGLPNVLGLGLLLAYTYGVMALHRRFRWPIVLAIAASALSYAVVGALLYLVLPAGEAAFWLAAAAMMAVGVALLRLPHRVEAGHRTPLPVWLKLPMIVAVVALLMLVKRYLGGFVTVFPMVGVIAAYEARTCLWTITRQIPVLIVTLLPMMLAMRLAQTIGGVALGASLAVGWLVFLAVLVPLSCYRWRRELATIPVPEACA